MSKYILLAIFPVHYIQIYLMKNLATFVKDRRKAVQLTQEEFAELTGDALSPVRKIEQGKTNLNMEKVNLVLQMFGHELAPVDRKTMNE